MSFLAINKKISFQFYFKEKMEAGIVLFGWEVKSLRLKRVELINSYITLDKNNELWLKNMFINPIVYIDKNFTNTNDSRDRKILLNKKEIIVIKNFLLIKGHTVSPTKLYLNDKNKIKVEIALLLGKKKIDKRELLKKKEWDIDKKRIF